MREIDLFPGKVKTVGSPERQAAPLRLYRFGGGHEPTAHEAAISNKEKDKT
jgi:hypothetical protein